MKPYNMLEKTKALFIIILLTLCTVSCTKAETIKTKAESPQASAPSFSADTSSNVTKSRIALNDVKLPRSEDAGISEESTKELS
jgi:outer membrane lipoprotein-sorting protein